MKSLQSKSITLPKSQKEFLEKPEVAGYYTPLPEVFMILLKITS